MYIKRSLCLNNVQEGIPLEQVIATVPKKRVVTNGICTKRYCFMERILI